jgi:endonuclease/exonuclease/phosphatase family metal-dependent hydrolase
MLNRVLCLLLGILPQFLAGADLSILTYNVGGNGTTNWSTNTAQVQAIGRQVVHLQPDIVTFNEIPRTNTWQMTNFVTAFLPGYFLAANSGSDGYIRSVIASRFPIARAQSWMPRANLAAFGFDGPFTRDLFEAEIEVPGFDQPLHVFTTHLKAGTALDDCERRGAEANAISNFLVTVFLPGKSTRPYVLTGDLNEDIQRPPGNTQHAVERLLSSPTGLRLTTPVNPFNRDDRTLSSSSPFRRYDYILPGGLLFSNLVTNQVFRTDLLSPLPSPLLSTDSRTASDHLPVLAVFKNPLNTPFRLVAFTRSNQTVCLTWEAGVNRQYWVEASSSLIAWTAASTNLIATTNRLSWSRRESEFQQFYRIHRAP